MSGTIDATAVAAILGLSVSTFYRKRALLSRLGFPGALPWNARRYNRAAVERFAAQWRDGPPAAVDPGGVVVLHPAMKAAAARRIAERARAT